MNINIAYDVDNTIADFSLGFVKLGRKLGVIPDGPPATWEDYEKHFRELTDAGLPCLLVDRPYNRDVDAGPLRIYSLAEVPAKVEALFGASVIH